MLGLFSLAKAQYFGVFVFSNLKRYLAMNNEELAKNTNWSDLFSRKDFWEEYFLGGGMVSFFYDYYNIPEDAEPDDKDDGFITIRIDLSSLYALQFELLFSGGLNYLTLHYRASVNEEFREQPLGWDSPSHAVHALRWEELQALTEFAKKHCNLGFNAVFFSLLLQIFTPATEANYSALFSYTETCLKEAGIFTEAEVADLVNKLTVVRPNLKWIYNEKLGWLATGNEVYSLRYYNLDAAESGNINSNFNFAAFKELMAFISSFPVPVQN